MEGQYPIDVDTLFKGRVITARELEHITGHQAGTDGFRFGVMTLQNFIHNRTNFTSKAHGDDLRVLTDAEASKYNHDRVRHHIKGIGQRHSLAMRVDAGQLDEAQRAEHDRRLMSQSRVVSALREASRPVVMPGYQKSTPGLLKKVS